MGFSSAVLYRYHRPVKKGRDWEEGRVSLVFLVEAGTKHDDGQCEVMRSMKVYDDVSFRVLDLSVSIGLLYCHHQYRHHHCIEINRTTKSSLLLLCDLSLLYH